MNWERQKATIIAEPEEPSLVLWLVLHSAVRECNQRR
jgi:hypothetical protein